MLVVKNLQIGEYNVVGFSDKLRDTIAKYNCAKGFIIL